jgi:hypothetical protein
MGPGMFDDLNKVFKFLAFWAAIGETLGLWKAVEVVWWLVTHVRFDQ